VSGPDSPSCLAAIVARGGVAVCPRNERLKRYIIRGERDLRSPQVPLKKTIIPWKQWERITNVRVYQKLVGRVFDLQEE
jgi:hypothetical protein